MPSIAKSLTTLLKHSDNQTLKNTVFSALPIRDPRSGNQIASPSDDETKSALKKRLWAIAQKRLYQAPTPKHLKHSLSSLHDSNRTVQDQDKDETLLSEAITEETVYFDDDDLITDGDPEFLLDAFPDDNELDLKNQDNYMQTEESSSSIMILEDTRAQSPPEFPETEQQEQMTFTTSPLPTEDFCPNSPDTNASLLSLSGHTEPDHEMLDSNFDLAEDIQFPSNQSQSQDTSGLQDLYSYSHPGNSSCEGGMPSSHTSFSHNPSFYVGPHMNEEEFEDLDEMFCDDL